MNVVRIDGWNVCTGGIVDVDVETRKILVHPALPKPSFDLCHAEKAIIVRGHLIHAIKSLRERTGLGLKEAKDSCDAWRRSPAYDTFIAAHPYLVERD